MSALAELEALGWMCRLADQGEHQVEGHGGSYFFVRRFLLIAEKGSKKLHGIAEFDAALLKVRPDRADKGQNAFWEAMLQEVKSQ